MKFSEKFHLRVPSKRVAMASRKVFCGARRPFITGIFPPMWDRQQLAEGHTIPGAQWTPFRGLSGAVGGHRGDSSPDPSTGISIYSHSASQGPEHGLARSLRLIPTPAAAGSGARSFSGSCFFEGGSSAAPQSTGSHQAQARADRDQSFLFTFVWVNSSQWQHGGSLKPLLSGRLG